jgi:hypothetical protein
MKNHQYAGELHVKLFPGNASSAQNHLAVQTAGYMICKENFS